MGLREKQKEMARALICEALAEIVVEQGPRTFSLEDVADRAGISLRTLYRYYPGREELLAALVERLEAELGEEETERGVPETLDEALASVSERMEFFSANEGMARAALAIIAGAERATQRGEATGALRLTAERRAERHARIRAFVDAEFPDLPDEVRDQVFAVVRTIGSLVGWGELTGPVGGLDGPAAGVATRWALRAIWSRAKEMQAAGVRRLEDDE